MNIQKFFYDEKEKMLSELRQETESDSGRISDEEAQMEYRFFAEKADMYMEHTEKNYSCPQKKTVTYQNFCIWAELSVRLAEDSGCNIWIRTLDAGYGIIKLQAEDIWLLSDGETSLAEKETMEILFREADSIYIGNEKRNGKTVIQIEFRFNLE